MNSRPNVPLGSLLSQTTSTVFELTYGRSLRTLRPSSVESMMSRRWGKAAPAVLSLAAWIIGIGSSNRRPCVRNEACQAPVDSQGRAFAGGGALRAEPTDKNAYSNQFRGLWPSKAGSGFGNADT